MLYLKIASLPLNISGHRLESLQIEAKKGWIRKTTVVRLSGDGKEGVGEDVTYEAEDQKAFQALGPSLDFQGTFTVEEFSRKLSGIAFFPVAPKNPASRHYRRWAFESAALDLALRQAGVSLAEILGREPRPVHFVTSLGLGDPASLAPIRKLCARLPDLRFKLDLAENWTESLVADLAATGAVSTVDLKGFYRGAYQGPPANPEQYRWVVEECRNIWIEDPELNVETEKVIRPVAERITWDAILHSVEDIANLPWKPACINIKASRFGSVSELMRVYEHCRKQGIEMYGGGQYELGPGRGQNQYLASLFHPEAANDVAPILFHQPDAHPELPGSPLAPALDQVGFRWVGGSSGTP